MGAQEDLGPADLGAEDLGPADQGVDLGIDLGAGDGGGGPWAHCPSADSYVGDPGWGASFTAGADALLCAYPRQNDPLLEAHARKLQLAVVPGSYPFPLTEAPQPFFLPVCFGPEPGEPSALEGTITTQRRQGFEDPEERYYVEARLPLSSGESLSISLKRSLDDPDFRLEGPVDDFGILSAQRCASDCLSPDDLFLLPCKLTPKLCDRLEFQDGRIDIEQFHWAGAVGAGFASPLRARGEFRGQSFDVQDYRRMTISYGHHAFTRELLVLFDAPIDGVCGLRFDEISEFGQVLQAQAVDCSGAALSTSMITGQEHLLSACP